MSRGKTYDFAVVGAGVFGAWTAWWLRKSGASVLLLDAYGPANARASSAGESRIIRMGYGPDEIYTRWSLRSLPLWKDLFARAGRPELFQPTGVLWIAQEHDSYALASAAALQHVGVPFEKLSLPDLRRRYPQFAFDEDSWAILEAGSGALMARRAVHAIVEQAQKLGVDYRHEAVRAPAAPGRVMELQTAGGQPIAAGAFVFACGAWLGKIFPALLATRIFASRQEIFFFGVPPGDPRFAPPAMPAWLFLRDEFYGMPDIENRGFKIANDRHGPPADPDAQSRIASPEAAQLARDFLGRRFPALKNAPIVETRVCQYENTSSGDFLIDRHPHHENVWLVGGGSGHGFKHGPALGEYVAARLLQGVPGEERFSLATKNTIQNRAIH
ncbi:MAG: FAD-dependent oxidoreductase [Candidatus Acidiferrales bacterium]